MADATAEVDHEAGTITLPVERFQLTDAEYRLIDDARGLAMDRCAKAEGIDLGWRPGRAAPVSDRRYGVWVPAITEQFGYAVPEGASAPDTDGPPLDDDDFLVITECASDPTVLSFRYESVRPGFDFAEEFSWVTTAAFGSPEGEAVFEDWEECLNAQGLHRDTSVSPFAVAGAGMAVTEQNIVIALKDVTCKSEVGFVQRLADLEAQLQAPIVAEHLAELEQMRSEYDHIVDAAREYLVSADVSVP